MNNVTVYLKNEGNVGSQPLFGYWRFGPFNHFKPLGSQPELC
jgi:hypothetical protein